MVPLLLLGSLGFHPGSAVTRWRPSQLGGIREGWVGSQDLHPAVTSPSPCSFKRSHTTISTRVSLSPWPGRIRGGLSEWVLSRVCLSGTPWTVARQASLSMGFSRQEDWSGLPFPDPGFFSWPRSWTHVSCIADSFCHRATHWEAPRGCLVGSLTASPPHSAVTRSSPTLVGPAEAECGTRYKNVTSSIPHQQQRGLPANRRVK